MRAEKEAAQVLERQREDKQIDEALSLLDSQRDEELVFD